MTTEEVRWMLQAADLRIERDLRELYGKPSPGVTADEAKDVEAVRMVFAILNSFMSPRCRSAFVTRVAEAVSMADGRVA